MNVGKRCNIKWIELKKTVDNILRCNQKANRNFERREFKKKAVNIERKLHLAIETVK